MGMELTESGRILRKRIEAAKTKPTTVSDEVVYVWIACWVLTLSSKIQTLSSMEHKREGDDWERVNQRAHERKKKKSRSTQNKTWCSHKINTAFAQIAQTIKID